MANLQIKKIAEIKSQISDLIPWNYGSKRRELGYIGEYEGVTFSLDYTISSNGEFYYQIPWLWSNEQTKLLKKGRNAFNLQLNEIRKHPKLVAMFNKFEKEFTDIPFTFKKVGGKILFTDKRSKEVLTWDLAKGEFSRTYKNRKSRVIRFPVQFFKKIDGRRIFIALSRNSDENWLKVMRLVIKNNGRCSNFGTFLMRTLDKMHLETYFALGYNTASDEYGFYDLNYPINWYAKDVRNKLLESGIRFSTSSETFFGSNVELGRTVFDLIKDRRDFKGVWKVLCRNLATMNTLVTYYNGEDGEGDRQGYGYNPKRLLEYFDSLGWIGTDRRGNKVRRIGFVDEEKSYDYDLPQYLMDYARMADLVYGHGNYDKYPKDIEEAHDTVTRLYNERKAEFDAQDFRL